MTMVIGEFQNSWNPRFFMHTSIFVKNNKLISQLFFGDY